MKFLSHQIESLAIVRDLSLIELDSEKLSIANKAKKLLRKLILDMNKDGIFKYVHRWKYNPERLKGVLFMDIVGDACHAFRSLKLY